MAREPLPPQQPDRRGDADLAFDPETGELGIGRFRASVELTRGNRAVLVAYVELTARARGQRVAELVEVRHADVEALAAALDLGAADLGSEIQEVLGATRAEAQRLVQRLRESKVLSGIAKAATTAAVAGVVVAGCASPSPSAGSRAQVAPTAEHRTSAHPVVGTDGRPVVEGPDGVGLIPPQQVDRTEVHLIPPADAERPASG